MYDGGDVVLVFDNTGNWQHRYLHGDAVDQVFMEESVGEILWGLADNQGTIRDVTNYDPQTDTSAVLNHRRFNAFGGITSETNSSINYRYAYTGRYFDEDTGIQYNRARWYDAETGRFLSIDPIQIASGDANFYRYVGNSPANASDPSGLAANWHHLLPQQYAKKFKKEGINIHSKQFGWIIDSEYHTAKKGLHPKWNQDWKKFFDSHPKAKKAEILKQLETMKKKYWHKLKNGKQATTGYKEWEKWTKKLNENAEKAKSATQKAADSSKSALKKAKKALPDLASVDL